MHIPKWLIAAAGLVLVALIAAVAFFIGHQTSQPPAAPIAASTPATEASGAAATPPMPTASASLPISSAPAAAVDQSPASDEARARVSAYFTQMEGLQSGEAVAEPEAFATTLLQGATSGDFSGIDDLVHAAGDAERRAAAIQPPGECAEYHRMAVTLLQESRTMITALRDGLKPNDTNALASVGASAQSMKSRTDSLAAAEKAIRARFGL
jgi:hypothetical protein